MDSIDYYNQNAKEYYNNTVDLNMGEVIGQFIGMLPDNATVLDLGCGSGRDSMCFLENGFDVTALDASKELCELAEIHIGQDVLHMDYRNMNFHNVFDGVWACASLLHIQTQDLHMVLNKIEDSLKPNGICYMSFQAGSFEGIRRDRFFKDYTFEEFNNLLSEHKNFEILDIYESEDILRGRSDITWLNIYLKVKKGVPDRKGRINEG